ncbi:MAG: response regulator, partial [Gammaproteobacteria bacterium]|nr:response regulator [Gammaproteobacteria bacterium]
LYQLLMNLCINARDAMNGCGNITIHLGMAKTLNAECSACHSELTGDWVGLSVTDTGGGIGPDKLKRIFDPFYTTKDVGKGTGMGLAVIHGIMRSHGGHILVETAAGVGSTFRLLFPPVSQEITAPQEPGPSSGIVPPGQGERILVLDDEPDLADYLGALLESNGYMVTVMNHSREALELFRVNPNEFVLLVTDQTMPEMTGIEMLTKMRELRPGLPVILNTGFSEDIDNDTAAAMGIHYLDKPVMANNLLQAVAELLGTVKQDTQ